MRLDKKLLFVAFIFMSISLSACSKDDGNNPSDSTVNNNELPGYTLVWSDEFDGSSIDQTKWEHEVNGNGGGNNELQYYTARNENSYVKDGNLHIAALREEYTAEDGTRYYTSARLRSANKGDWKYGRIDVKAIIPVGQGLWPAIWMLPTDWEYGGWPTSGEIDIMEHVNEEVYIHGSVHTESYNHKIGTQKTGKIAVQDASVNFHVYSVTWTEDKIDFMVDDQVYYTFLNDKQGNYKTWPFDKRFHLILNVAVGGSWPGNPTPDTVFPSEMIIDYVKVYEKTN